MNLAFAGKGYGTAVMDFIKAWFRSDENKTGCGLLLLMHTTILPLSITTKKMVSVIYILKKSMKQNPWD